MKFLTVLRSKRADGSYIGFSLAMVITVILGAIVVAGTVGLLDGVIVPGIAQQMDTQNANIVESIDINDGGDSINQLYKNQVFRGAYAPYNSKTVWTLLDDAAYPCVKDISCSVLGTPVTYNDVLLRAIPDKNHQGDAEVTDSLTVLSNKTGVITQNIGAISLTGNEVFTLASIDMSAHTATCYFYPDAILGDEKYKMKAGNDESNVYVWSDVLTPTDALSCYGAKSTVSGADGKIYITLDISTCMRFGVPTETVALNTFRTNFRNSIVYVAHGGTIYYPLAEPIIREVQPAV